MSKLMDNLLNLHYLSLKLKLIKGSLKLVNRKVYDFLLFYYVPTFYLLSLDI